MRIASQAARFSLVIFLLVLGREANAQSEFLRDQYCEGIGNALDCAREVEQHHLQQYRVRAERQDTILRLRLQSGDQLELEDGEQRVITDEAWYALVDYNPETGFYLVRVQYIEGNSYLLVDERTGHQHSIQDVPIFSPDWNYFVTASMDLEAGYNPTGLEIWSVGAYPLREWALQTTNWGPSDVQWVDKRTVRFLKNKLTPEGEYEQAVIYLRRDDDEWKLMMEEEYLSR